jgi:hypothetical protein
MEIKRGRLTYWTKVDQKIQLQLPTGLVTITVKQVSKGSGAQLMIEAPLSVGIQTSKSLQYGT